MTAPVPHRMQIATEVRKKIKAGVAMRVILDDIQKYPDAPTSMNTLYKVYRSDIAEARADIQEEMGSVVINAAREGDWKAAELFLRSKAGWSPTQTIVEADPEDENSDTGAIDDLLALLGQKKEKKEE